MSSSPTNQQPGDAPVSSTSTTTSFRFMDLTVPWQKEQALLAVNLNWDETCSPGYEGLMALDLPDGIDFLGAYKGGVFVGGWYLQPQQGGGAIFHTLLLPSVHGQGLQLSAQALPVAFTRYHTLTTCVPWGHDVAKALVRRLGFKVVLEKKPFSVHPDINYYLTKEQHASRSTHRRCCDHSSDSVLGATGEQPCP